MPLPRARSSLLNAALALALAAACHPGGARLPLRLFTRSCSGTPPLEGATHLRLRVTGEGMQPLERLVPVGAPPQLLEDVPAGPARVLEVRAYERRPEEGGRVLALGRSAAFDVPEDAGALPEARVVLRRVNAFTPTSDPEHPEACTALAQARAGHSATLLPDGRVLLAGGYALASDVPQALASAELYAPDTGTLVPAPALPGPRAFHTATRLPSGRVLLAGGEAAAPLGDALLFDPAQGTFRALPLERPRSRHTAAVDAGGHVLLAGGVGEAGAVLAVAEGMLPEEGRSVPVAVPLPRLGAVALPAAGGQVLAVLGGSDGATLASEVPRLRFEAGAFVSAGPSSRLLQPRRGAAAAPWGEGALLLGGFDTPVEDPATQRALATSELLPLATGGVPTQGPNVGPRAEPCAVALPDGRVLTVGGRTSAPGVPVRSSAAAELVVPPAAGVVSPLPVVLGLPRLEASRSGHTCTLLPDGTVLVAGGLREDTDETGGALREVRADLLVFTPAPVD